MYNKPTPVFCCWYYWKKIRQIWRKKYQYFIFDAIEKNKRDMDKKFKNKLNSFVLQWCNIQCCIGWESQLLETGFLAAFLCPLWSCSQIPSNAPTSLVVLFAFKWLIFRIMVGAVIKVEYLRGKSDIKRNRESEREREIFE